MSERLMLEGKLSSLENTADRLAMRINALCRDIRVEINPALVDDVEELDISTAAMHMDDLVVHQAELVAARSRIARIKKELGRG